MTTEKLHWLERPIHPALPGITNEIALFVAVILMSIVTRFYDLETRVMSHDESLHTYFSWLFYRGQGYQHSPMMHGPLQFHLIAVSYFLFGVTDFTSRIPAVLFSIATVWMVWYWRRYLGKTGAIIAGILMVISPYMLYYGRYVRNEAYAGFAGILMLYAILRYLEKGNKRYLYLIALSLVIHFTAKETAFIYAAQALLFLGIYFIAQVTNKPWDGNESQFRTFIILLALSILLIGGALGYGLYARSGGTLTSMETAMPADPSMPHSPLAAPDTGISLITILVIAGALALIVALAFLIRGFGWYRLKMERSFDLLVLIGTLVLPMLAPFPIKFLEGWLRVTIPTTAPEIDTLLASQDLILGLPREFAIIGVFIVILFAASIAIGQLWSRGWWKPALLFWGIFTILYTSVFTNSDGFFTGLIGSLGYWLVQQGVERGSQPWYYYALIQIPVYEFLPALGTLLATYFGIKKLTRLPRLESASAESEEVDVDEPIEPASKPDLEPATVTGIDLEPESDPVERNFANTFSLLLWWVVTSVIALSYAGERMPWLTYHMAWPMVLLAGWGIGHGIEKINWKSLRPTRTALTLILTILFIIGLFSSISSLLGVTPPFQGKDLAQLQATAAFLFPAILTLASAGGLAYLLGDEMPSLMKMALLIVFILGLIGTILVAISIPTGSQADSATTVKNVVRLTVIILITIGSLVGLFLLREREGGSFPGLVTLTFFGFLAILTARASFRASYINYDSAKEYLVYAHGATGVKQVMAQAKEISQRTTGGMGLALSYDASAPDTGVSWPFVWYLRDYTNQRSFDQPTKALRDTVFVVVDAKNFDKIEPALGPGYYRFDYIRMWWPSQDYFGLTRERIADALRNPQVRAGIWDIWFDRDYTRYANALARTDLSPTNWQPADQMRLYIRKDVAAQIWNYGAAPVETVDIVDPTEGKAISLATDLVIDAAQAEPVLLNAPRSLAFAPDGTLYVADSRNNRIVHFEADGKVIGSWGTLGGVSAPADPGTFNEPWGLAVGPDGSVYVSDTWNHRIQKFTPDGQPITSWGQYGQADQQDGFWGPRGLAVDAEGNVYVADTGNKRIVVFDADGNYLTEFGSAGLEPGQFDEPVGVAIDANGMVYVTDTWNQRVQTFEPADDKSFFFPVRQWDVFGWYGQSLDNKPFIAVNAEGHVFVTDPEQYRVIEFTGEGEVVRTWGDFGDTSTTFGLASGIAVDAEGRVWVTDGAYNRIMRFTLPNE
ncbi:MAG: TIGR03663 family protein [Anaerolineales bacterium]|nr:TIGR03663 family protein [Anaerolineales bacterium]